MFNGAVFRSNINDIKAQTLKIRANPAMIYPDQMGNGVWVIVRTPRPTQGNMRNNAQSKCARAALSRYAARAKRHTKLKGIIAKAKSPHVKTKAEVKCSSRVSFSAKPIKNQIAVRVESPDPIPATSAARRSALRPAGFAAGTAVW